MSVGYPTERCDWCGNMVMYTPGLVCDECLRHNGLHHTQDPDPDDRKRLCFAPRSHGVKCRCKITTLAEYS